MTKTKAESYANLARHYRSQGDLAKAERYEAMAREGSGDSVRHGEALSEEGAGASEGDLKDVVAMVSLGAWQALAERFGGMTSPGISSAVSSALVRNADRASAEAYLDRLPASQEFKLKRKALDLRERMAAVDLSDQPRVHLLLLSYNRVKYVANALRQLAATDYDNYAVYIADNASHDGSWEIVQKAREYFPEHIEVHVERLPTNIGRPAGHNWLLEKYDHSAAEFIAIGDDDLLDVPPSWLKDMIRTARIFPEAGAVGGKALDPGQPKVIHGGVRKLLQFGPDELKLTNDEDSIDFGQFDYIDRVDHVIGCLHIYRRDVLFEKVGLFDIRFSPCQYVDIDHHLRMRMMGIELVYNGFIEFQHLRAMGKQAAQDSALGGNSLGNRIKILYKHDHKEVVEFLDNESRRHSAWLEAPVGS